MDELDMKIQETLKSSQTGEDVVQKIGPIEEEEIMRFLSEHRASGYTPLKVLTGKEITLYGADVNLLSVFPQKQRNICLPPLYCDSTPLFLC